MLFKNINNFKQILIKIYQIMNAIKQSHFLKRNMFAFTKRTFAANEIKIELVIR
jgi:hypothetical protein